MTKAAAQEANQQWLALENNEGQYSLWPVTQPVPDGWKEVGPEGDKEEVLSWIAAAWTDMRPKSIRK